MSLELGARSWELGAMSWELGAMSWELRARSSAASRRSSIGHKKHERTRKTKGWDSVHSLLATHYSLLATVFVSSRAFCG